MPEGVPDWAKFFTADKWREFERQVHRYFQRNEIPHDIRDGIVYLHGGDKPGHQMGLLNVAQNCNMDALENYEAIVGKHFDKMQEIFRETREIEQKSGDFEAMRHMIAVRVGPTDMPASMLVMREDLPGTISYLVLDQPQSIVSLQPDFLSRWGRSREELFRIALENVKRLAQPNVAVHDLEEGVKIVALMGESYFTASHVLNLADYPLAQGTHGTLVAVPHRSAVLAYPIENVETIKALQQIILIAHGMFEDGPGSITPNVYWFKEGKFTLIPAELKDQQLTVTPPDEFVEMLNKLV